MNCNCENTTCQVTHPAGGCTNVAEVKTTHDSICQACAEFMPAEYLAPYFPEPWQVDFRVGGKSVILVDADDLAFAVLIGKDDARRLATAHLFVEAPRLLRLVLGRLDIDRDLTGQAIGLGAKELLWQQSAQQLLRELGGCLYCQKGLPRVPSAVKPGGFIHNDDRDGRVLCTRGGGQ